MGIDVLDHHGGVIDQNTNGQCQTAEGHNVDGLPGPAEADDRAQDRQWNGGGDDDGRAPGAKEQQDHDAGQESGRYHFAHDVLDGVFHESGSICENRDLDVRGQDFTQAWQKGLDPVDDVQGRGSAALHDDDFDALTAFNEDYVRLGVPATIYVCHVVNVDHGIADALHRNVADGFHAGGCGVCLHHPVHRIDFLVTSGEDDVLVAHGSLNVHRGKVMSAELVLIERNHHKTVHAAIWVSNDRTRDCDEKRTHGNDAEFK